MPRVRAPDFPRRGPGSAKVKNSTHIRSRYNKRQKCFQKLSLKDTDDVNDDLSFTSSSSEDKESTCFSKSSIIVTPKLVTKSVERRSYSSPTNCLESAFVDDMPQHPKPSTNPDKKHIAGEEYGSNRKVSFCSVVQEMTPSIATHKAVHRVQLKPPCVGTKCVSDQEQYDTNMNQFDTLSQNIPKTGTVVTPPQWTFVTHSDSIKSKPKQTNMRTSMEEICDKPNVVPHVHCLAVDTRCLQTSRGNSASQQFIHLIQDFLCSCSSRGILPRYLSVPHRRSNEETKGLEHIGKRARGGTGTVDISTHALSRSTNNEAYYYSMLPRVLIRPPSNIGNINHRDKNVHLPKLLSAHESWTMFASFVESMVEKHRDAKCYSESSQPLDIRILTNDIALFSDNDTEHHRCGLDLFRDKTRHYFDKAFIKTISIVIVDTDTFALWEEYKSLGSSALSTSLCNTKSPTPQFSLSDDIAAQSNMLDGSNKIGVGDLVSNEDAENKNLLLSKLFHPYRLKVKECLKFIQDRLSIMSNLESKYAVHKNMSNPIHVDLNVMNCNSVSFQSMLIDWAMDVVRSIGTRFGFTGGMARIQFDLPCTSDGTQCSIALDLTYTIFPHRLDLPNELWTDMMRLHNASFRILKMISDSDIDLSLIYGIPFSAKPSSEGELQQFKEMRLLVQQLCKYLTTHQVAIVLQLEQPTNLQNCDGKACLYHSDNQIFLLVAEEKYDKTSPSPNFVLFRYAHSSSQITYRYGSYDLGYPQEDEISETEHDIYYNYIVRSLEYVDTSAINPFSDINKSTTEQKSESQDLSKVDLSTPSDDDILNLCPSKMIIDMEEDEENLNKEYHHSDSDLSQY